MGVGKSTVGPILARRLGLPFLDLDLAVACAAGRSVAEIFAEEGEAGFREREAAAVSRACLGAPCVLALGGGTLHSADNLARLRARFKLIILHLSWSELEPRLASLSGEDRPLLTRSRGLYQARQAGYAAAGTLVDVTGLGPDAAADAVMAALEVPCATPRA